MLDRKTLATLDLVRINARSLSPADWQALKREVARRGQAERVAVSRRMVGRLLAWLRAQRPEPGTTARPVAPRPI